MNTDNDSRCGARNSGPVTSLRLSSARHESRCCSCGTSQLDPYGHCRICRNRTAPTYDRCELQLPDSAAAATDVGHRAIYNQDAIAIGSDHDHAVAVICDGISQSTFGELAALRAAEAGVDHILTAVASGEDSGSASQHGAHAAANAATQAGADIETAPPGCTYASVVVTRETVAVVSIGDSRAYWLSGNHAECLTIDDTHAGHLAASAVPFDDPRYRAPHANALLRWLGADAPAIDTQVAVHRPDRRGIVLLCSDGLSGYTNQPRDLLPIPDGPPVVQVREFTARALECGGYDNISVAVVPFPKGPM